jgi:hypothetical protein
MFNPTNFLYITGTCTGSDTDAGLFKFNLCKALNKNKLTGTGS